MKFSAAFSIILDLRFAIQLAVIPTLKEAMRSPSIFLKPTALSRLFMSKLWFSCGNEVDQNGRPVKQALITPNAYGVVLDLGAGHGHTINYLDRSRVSRYIALEPNELMHPQIRALANASGFHESDGTLLIISCGAEDTASVMSSLNDNGEPQQIDTLVSILTLCTIPRPEEALTALIREVLNPGGQLLFYEHVLSAKDDVAWWQRFWTPIWKLVFDGCRLDRPTHIWLQKMLAHGEDGNEEGMWSETDMWGKEDEPEENLFWHRAGKFIKYK